MNSATRGHQRRRWNEEIAFGDGCGRRAYRRHRVWPRRKARQGTARHEAPAPASEGLSPTMKKGADIKSGAEMKAEHQGRRRGQQGRVRRPRPTTTVRLPRPTEGQAVDHRSRPTPRPRLTERQVAARRRSRRADDKAAGGEVDARTRRPAPAAGSSAQGTQAPARQRRRPQRRASAPAAAGASVNLTTEQKTKIRTTVLQSSSAPKVSRSQINFTSASARWCRAACSS